MLLDETQDFIIVRYQGFGQIAQILENIVSVLQVSIASSPMTNGWEKTFCASSKVCNSTSLFRR